MTELEKRIYNKHLAVSRSLRNKPFKLKNNFTGFEDDSKYISVKRIAVLATKYPDLDLDTYFMAPYKLYPDVEYFDLGYFASPRALKSYTIYKQELLHKSPDSQIEDVTDSLRFIAKFCIDNSIDLTEYPTFCLKGIEPEWMYHIKKKQINLYSLMEFSNISDLINQIPSDEQELLLGDFALRYFDYKSKYLNSSKLRPFLQEAFIKIKLFIDKNLNKTKQLV